MARKVGSPLRRLNCSDLVAGQDQLADQVHQLVEQRTSTRIDVSAAPPLGPRAFAVSPICGFLWMDSARLLGHRSRREGFGLCYLLIEDLRLAARFGPAALNFLIALNLMTNAPYGSSLWAFVAILPLSKSHSTSGVMHLPWPAARW